VNGELPDNPALHAALVVYASARSLLDTAWRVVTVAQEGVLRAK
jgi:acyl-CoA thioesterase